MDFYVALSSIVDRLKVAGLDASLDPADVNPPGILVAGDTVSPIVKLNRGDRIRASVILYARDNGDAHAYQALSELYESVVAALGSLIVPDDAPFERRGLPGGPTALPTLRLTATITDRSIHHA